MAKPKLIFIEWPDGRKENKGKCSACGAGLEAPTHEDLNVLFAAHVKERHSGEDVNQAAARIVREATE